MNDLTRDLLEALKYAASCLGTDGNDPIDLVIARAEAALAELQPDADGWIPWAGGECPVDSKSWVEVKLRDGEACIDQEAQMGADWFWDHDGGADDIIAYRVVKR